MAKRDVAGRYRGSIVGILWSFLNPILMLCVYTFVFSVVFKTRWGDTYGSDDKTEFAIILFAGMIIYALFSECINRSPALVLNNPNFVKKVVFPLEILTWVAMASSVFHALVSFAVLVGFYAIIHHFLHWTLLLLPLILTPLILLTAGLSWFTASTGVYLRDVGQTIGIITTILMFLSPVFYPVSALPEQYRLFMHLNPLTFPIEQAREVILWGRLPDWRGLGLYFAVSLLVAWLGFAWFQKTRKGFADVM